ncbi:MAG: hypothetical protein K0R54_4736 [Clostridiaceae bacterium]|jgi:hypothetical protein|nr:hypothetical protein [Clostridiaceae bacterium]
MKSLKIKSDNCILVKNTYGVEINKKDIRDLVLENLPSELKNYEKYPSKISINIEFLGDDELTVETEGYKVENEGTEPAETKEGE